MRFERIRELIVRLVCVLVGKPVQQTARGESGYPDGGLEVDLLALVEDGSKKRRRANSSDMVVTLPNLFVEIDEDLNLPDADSGRSPDDGVLA